ncbi:hypothetical protein C922_05086 [Plasmodium inui San Antonio 1]|uniref:Uncharacterized protein n=1 Tax=Plasmodium inui San Antonio 1 TaxID=1237626 RepID=W7A639_9APIC|nr:hypothetical protein C922_05086 [Plasmodium inui San Antonio 1]EUD64524.1 hypothetical protein C922_05086 [Plasmodium inui San Antonio 1]
MTQNNIFRIPRGDSIINNSAEEEYPHKEKCLSKRFLRGYMVKGKAIFMRHPEKNIIDITQRNHLYKDDERKNILKIQRGKMNLQEKRCPTREDTSE